MPRRYQIAGTQPASEQGDQSHPEGWKASHHDPKAFWLEVLRGSGGRRTAGLFHPKLYTAVCALARQTRLKSRAFSGSGGVIGRPLAAAPGFRCRRSTVSKRRKGPGANRRRSGTLHLMLRELRVCPGLTRAAAPVP
jgi:hypothetical protein